MLQIRSEAFIGLGRVAGFLRNHSQLMNALAVLLEEEERTTFIDQIERLASACKDLELTTAATVVAKTLARLKAAETLSWLTVKSDYDHVMEIIEIELAQHVFLWVQPTRVKYWRPEIPDVVQTRFGSAADDIRHASVCIALEADTASVYHSINAGA